MNTSQDEANEHLLLKTLLQDWKVPHFFHHFLAQKINVEILTIMKHYHINEALKPFTLGDRIRFEYEFENWRFKMGIPLERNRIPIGLPKDFTNEKESNETAVELENCETATTQEFLEEAKLQTPISNGQPMAHQTTKPTRASVSPTTVTKNSQTISESPTGNILRHKRSKPTYEEAAIDKPKKRKPLPFVPPKELIASPISFTLNARAILMQCLPRGPQLIQTYETRNEFTPCERTELINLLADYFYLNAIHLSLKMSHILEQQILKLFPGERLKDYRTEKRGRIYTRLGNIKNFKARIARAKRKDNNSLQQFVISSLEEDGENHRNMIDDELDELPMLDETNAPKHILCDETKTDVESNSADHFEYNEIKAEVVEDFS